MIISLFSFIHPNVNLILTYIGYIGPCMKSSLQIQNCALYFYCMWLASCSEFFRMTSSQTSRLGKDIAQYYQLTKKREKTSKCMSGVCVLTYSRQIVCTLKVQRVYMISEVTVLIHMLLQKRFQTTLVGLKNGDRQRHAVLPLMNKLIIYGLPRRRALLLIHKICLPTQDSRA